MAICDGPLFAGRRTYLVVFMIANRPGSPFYSPHFTLTVPLIINLRHLQFVGGVNLY